MDIVAPFIIASLARLDYSRVTLVKDEDAVRYYVRLRPLVIYREHKIPSSPYISNSTRTPRQSPSTFNVSTPTRAIQTI